MGPVETLTTTVTMPSWVASPMTTAVAVDVANVIRVWVAGHGELIQPLLTSQEVVDFVN